MFNANHYINHVNNHINNFNYDFDNEDLYNDEHYNEHKYNDIEIHNVYIRFNFSDGKLTASRGDGTHQTAAWLEAVKVLGWPSKPSSVAMGGNSLGFKYDAGTQVLTVRKPGVNLSEKNWSIDIKS